MASQQFKLTGMVKDKGSYQKDGQTTYTVEIDCFGGSHQFRYKSEPETRMFPDKGQPVVVEGTFAVDQRGIARFTPVLARVCTPAELMAAIAPPAQQAAESDAKSDAKQGK